MAAADVPPAAVGARLSAVDTPACIVDLDALEANVRRAAAAVARAAPGVKIRPHAKSHKTTQIAALQIALSEGLTTGVCCQKVVEAEAMVAAGVLDVLVSNQVVGASKIARLVDLARKSPTVSVLVDDASNVAELSTAAAAAGVTLGVLVEVDVGQARCGVATAEDAVALATVVASSPGLRLLGIQAYHGAAQHVRAEADRARVIAGVCAKAAAVRDALVAAGLCCDVVTGGGTGTFMLEATSGVFTEVQPGSYIFLDADYARNEDAEGVQMWGPPRVFAPAATTSTSTAAVAAATSTTAAASTIPGSTVGGWTPSLFMLTTVMSRRMPPPAAAADAPAAAATSGSGGGGGWVVLDSGLKAQSTDSGNPVVVASAAEYEGATAAAGAAGTGTGASAVPFDYATGRFASRIGGLAVKGVSDEHTTLVPATAAAASAFLFPALGEKVLLMPGHCDPTVNHFDWVVAVRKGLVEGVWRINARSPGI